MSQSDVVAFTIAAGFMGLSMTLAGTFTVGGPTGIIQVGGVFFTALGYFAAKFDERRAGDDVDEVAG